MHFKGNQSIQHEENKEISYSSQAWETGILWIFASCRSCRTVFFMVWICDIALYQSNCQNNWKTRHIFTKVSISAVVKVETGCE